MKADGNVEVWLMSLMKMAHHSMHCVIRTAAMAIQDSSFQLLEFLNMFPAQVYCLSYIATVVKVKKTSRGYACDSSSAVKPRLQWLCESSKGD